MTMAPYGFGEDEPDPISLEEVRRLLETHPEGRAENAPKEHADLTDAYLDGLRFDKKFLTDNGIIDG